MLTQAEIEAAAAVRASRRVRPTATETARGDGPPVKCLVQTCGGATRFLAKLDGRREQRACNACGLEFVTFDADVRARMVEGRTSDEAIKVLNDARRHVLGEHMKTMHPPARPGGHRVDPDRIPFKAADFK